MLFLAHVHKPKLLKCDQSWNFVHWYVVVSLITLRHRHKQ